jgi:hypothetical protein
MKERKMRNGKNRLLAWTGWLGLLAAAGGLLLFGGCEGSATQTTNGLQPGEMQGVLVDQQGNPVAGAAVSAWSGGGEPGKGSAAEAVTDARGVYLLKGLNDGTYNVFASKDDDGALIPAVTLQAGGLALDTTTLKPTGRISGGVANAAGPLEQAFAYVPGSSFVSITGSDGNFTLDRVPEGTYAVRYAATGYLSASDSGVKVEAGKTTQLDPKVLDLDVAGPLPAPTGFSAHFDPATGVVKLTWQRLLLDNIQFETRISYGNGTDSIIHWWGMPDTEFIDSFSRQNFNPGGRWEKAGKGVVSYQVRTIDIDGYASRFSAPFKVEMHAPTAYKNDVTFGPQVADTASCHTAFSYMFRFAAPDSEALTRYYGVQWRSPGASEYSSAMYFYNATDGGDYGSTADTSIFNWSPGLGMGSRYDWNNMEFRFVVEAHFISGWNRDFIVELKGDGKGCFTASPARAPAPADSFPDWSSSYPSL